MKTLASIFTAIVAAMHTGFLVLEMFLWETPYAQKAFNITAEFAKETAFMASNQGLYNGFLAAGLIWGLIAKKRDVTVFFLLCVVIAGIFGALTVKPSIFFIQAVPALLALGFVTLSRSK